jgi:hypothetical protein
MCPVLPRIQPMRLTRGAATPRLFPKASFPECAWMGGLPTIRSYVNKATEGRHKRNKTGSKTRETTQYCVLWDGVRYRFGTTEGEKEWLSGP